MPFSDVAAKNVGVVIIIRPMSFRCMSVAAAPEASAMVAYSLTLCKMMAMGLGRAYE